MRLVIAFAGWSGAALVLGAYALVSMRKQASDSASFQAMNIVGAVGLATSAAANDAWASAVVNVLWIAIGVVVTLRRRPAPQLL
jgi:hypothetical protein